MAITHARPEPYQPLRYSPFDVLTRYHNVILTFKVYVKSREAKSSLCRVRSNLYLMDLRMFLNNR
jgi:hypothetical protein